MLQELLYIFKLYFLRKQFFPFYMNWIWAVKTLSLLQGAILIEMTFTQLRE